MTFRTEGSVRDDQVREGLTLEVHRDTPHTAGECPNTQKHGVVTSGRGDRLYP